MKMMKKILTTGVALASIFTLGINSVFAETNYDIFNGYFDNHTISNPDSGLQYLIDNNIMTNGAATEVNLDEPAVIEAFYVAINNKMSGYVIVQFWKDGQVVHSQSVSKNGSSSDIADQTFTIESPIDVDKVKLVVSSMQVKEFEMFEVNNSEGGQDSTDSETTKEEEVTFGLLSSGLELTTSPITTFGDIQLQSTPQTYFTSFEGVYNVKDLRGTQEGWRLDVSATPFQVVEPNGGFASGTSAHQLPVGSLTLSPIESIAAVGQSSGALPTSELSNNTIVDDGVITVAKADVGTGMGEFNLTFPTNALSLVIDASTAKIDMVNYPDGKTPYESVLTWDLVSAP